MTNETCGTEKAWRWAGHFNVQPRIKAQLTKPLLEHDNVHKCSKPLMI